jgi:hypothetical protein
MPNRGRSISLFAGYACTGYKYPCFSTSQWLYYKISMCAWGKKVHQYLTWTVIFPHTSILETFSDDWHFIFLIICIFTCKLPYRLPTIPGQFRGTGSFNMFSLIQVIFWIKKKKNKVGWSVHKDRPRCQEKRVLRAVWHFSHFFRNFSIRLFFLLFHFLFSLYHTFSVVSF